MISFSVLYTKTRDKKIECVPKKKCFACDTAHDLLLLHSSRSTTLTGVYNIVNICALLRADDGIRAAAAADERRTKDARI